MARSRRRKKINYKTDYFCFIVIPRIQYKNIFSSIERAIQFCQIYSDEEIIAEVFNEISPFLVTGLDKYKGISLDVISDLKKYF